jgi:hypothetical protein
MVTTQKREFNIFANIKLPASSYHKTSHAEEQVPFIIKRETCGIDRGHRRRLFAIWIKRIRGREGGRRANCWGRGESAWWDFWRAKELDRQQQQQELS